MKASQEHILLSVPVSAVVPDLEWTPFFFQWGFQGGFPHVLSHPQKGEQARQLWADVQHLLANWENGIHAPELRAVASLFPALSRQETVDLYRTDSDKDPFEHFFFLRNQEKEGSHACLADFVRSKEDEQGIKDRVGCFVLTAAWGLDAALERSGAAQDAYQSMLAHTLAFRLAEAFSEYLHRRVSQEWFGSNQSVGIRPAPGYPTCPDHSEKARIFNLLQAEDKIGVHLTEGFAMLPQASIAGYYFFDPNAHYFRVGPIGADQKKLYARNKGMSEQEIQKYII